MRPSHALRLRCLAAATAAITLAACGGGSDGDSETSAPTPAPAPAPAPAPLPTVSATCDQLTSGTYRLITPADAEASTVTVTMDESGTPQLAYADGTADSLQAGAEACAFTTAKNADSLVVGKGGVAVIAANDAGSARYPALLFPEQAADVADLSGTWNRIAWQRSDASGPGPKPFMLEYGTITIAAGSVSAAQFCDVTTTSGTPIGCTAAAPQASFVANPSGGFTGAGNNAAGSRSFVFKNGSDTLLVMLEEDGSVNLLTKQETRGYPTVGATSSSWNLQATTSGAVSTAATDTLPGISTSTNTTTAVDTAAGTITRNASSAGAAAVSQTLYNNAPLPGMRVRQGVAGSVSPAVMLQLTSSLTAVGRLNATEATTPGTGNGFLVLSVGKP